MIGLVVVSHGSIGVEMLAAAAQIVGPLPQSVAISIGTDDDMDLCREKIFEAVKKVDSGKGVILLTDMFGGTPSNLALSIMPNTHTVVLAGANLPMVIKIAGVRSSLSLLDAVREAEAAGHKYIQLVTENLTQTKPVIDD